VLSYFAQKKRSSAQEIMKHMKHDKATGGDQ
jgi:hypothetical protein